MGRKTRIVAFAAAIAAAIPLAACSAGASGDGEGTSAKVNWWTWDPAQGASYQKCVAPFEKANPGITVKISQYGWGDYWPKLTASFLAGNGPDAFQDNAGYYPQFAAQKQLLPLNDLIAQSGLKLDQYAVGNQTWKYSDGKTYGLSMDWGVTGFYYNADLVRQAGLTAKDLADLTWNPQGGGSFEKVVAHLTVDANGVRGDQPGFDPKHIKVYGISNQGSSNLNGGDTWAQFAATTGWTLGDKANWPTTLKYSDSRFEQTASFLRNLSQKGYSPEMGQFTVGLPEQLGSGKVAIVADGSWMATTYAALKGVTVGIAASVIGPDGQRAALSNSNGNSIAASTKNKDAAWKWVSYQESEQCQSIAGKDGTFFPSIPASMKVTTQAMADKGIDISPFTDQLKAGQVFESPMYANGQNLQATIQPLLEAYFTFQRGDDALEEADKDSVSILAK